MTTRPSYAHIAHHASFEHERLKLSDKSVRLFQVQRGGKDEPISLRMTQFAAHRQPKYKAISYTWGDSANPKNILVNGKSFPLHINLWELLFHLRLNEETSFFWADALCINQLNLRERNFHVQLMGKIYQNAESVIVWLGVPCPEQVERRAFEFIKELVAFRKSYSDAAFISTYFKPEKRTVERWKNLSRMTNHPYWHRTWIIQEFLFAPDIEVFSGRHKLDWPEFESLIDFLKDEPRALTHRVIPQILQSRTTRLTLRRKAANESSLHDLLREYSDSTCTERRDKVYGILGLAVDCAEDALTGESAGVKPDYDKHIFEVYLDALDCIRASLPSSNILPAAALLVLKALHIRPADVSEFIGELRRHQQIISPYWFHNITVTPEYMSTVLTVFQWQGTRDLQAQLESYEWGDHVGREVIQRIPSNILVPNPRVRLRRNSSRTTHAALPADFISNVVEAANFCTDLSLLHNYAQTEELKIPLEQIESHPEDKRALENTGLSKPPVILEQRSDNEILRLGFASTNVQRGDCIVQFKGLDSALIMREMGYSWFLIGKAIMIRHADLSYGHEIDPICSANTWSSHCWDTENPESWQFTTDPLSLAELLLKT